MKSVFSMAVLLAITAGAAASPTISTGMLEKAKYTIASPTAWNGNLLILAHGYRPTDAILSAEVPVSATPYKQLIADGWIVAATSYRRNGMVIRDGSQDVELLRRHIAKQFGRPHRTFVVGWSMGGAVATIIAETGGEKYHGVLAIGASLMLRDKSNPYRMTYRPQVPILFLTNQNELKSSSDYVRQAGSSTKPVAIWVVNRDGHCKVNGEEIGLALQALVTCDQSGKLEDKKDFSIGTANRQSVVTFRDGRGYGKVTRIGKGFGNIHTEFTQKDMDRLGIEPGSHFVTGSADKSFRVFYGKQYGDVPNGEWVAFITADDILMIARCLANAAQELHCEGGEEIYIAPDPTGR